MIKSSICICVMGYASVFSGSHLNAKEPEKIPKIRRELMRIDSDEGVPLIIQLGEKTFPEFEEILSDPKARPVEIYRTFYYIAEINADRSRFLEHAVQRASDPNDQIRSTAARLLGKIGSVTEASLLVALLSDKDFVAVNAAATALAAIGGPRELVALDAWLLGVAHADYPQLREHVKKCRTELVERLARRPLPKK